ncbi:cell wall-binding repeat-containing protein [Halalkalibacter okhensis]|uniref:cell wall-binding repeat-containing protein n=1 Tax=Halalkalibacter okhensis TaxID=333138 RepID=UPI00068C6904|nr:cell wall-binding repeat-containing protein [Halalkalibacter okhensis]
MFLRRNFTMLLVVLLVSSLVMPFQAKANSETDRIVSLARSLVGSPYSWGGTTPSGFDCSGFMRYVYSDVGVDLHRMTVDQFNQGTSVSRNDLQPGDAVFFKNTYQAGISHAGIYVGNNQFVHASSSAGVTTTSLSNSYWNPRYAGAKRFVKEESQEKKASETVKPEPKEESLIDSNINVKKLVGKSRMDTSVEISKEMYPNGFDKDRKHKTVILTTSTEFADALSAAPLSAKYGDAPILLTRSQQLDSVIDSEIKRLGANKVIILGGEAAVSKKAMTQAADIVGESNVTRISGKTRYETNRKINEKLDSVDGYFVASGQNFADALGAAPIAAQNNWGIVLTNPSKINDEQLDMLQGKKVHILGGEMAVSKDVSKKVSSKASNVKRLSGSSRYETLGAVLKEFNAESNSEKVYMATGQDFPDALAAAPLVAKANGVLVLSSRSVDSSIERLMTNPKNLYVIGGVVPNSAMNDILKLDK